MVKFFPHQHEHDFQYIYPHQMFLEAAHDGDVEEVLDWCSEHLTSEWSYIWVTAHVNMRPQEACDIPYSELRKHCAKDGAGDEPWDWLAHGAYRPYLRLTFSSPDDASLFKLRFAGDE